MFPWSPVIGVYAYFFVLSFSPIHQNSTGVPLFTVHTVSFLAAVAAPPKAQVKVKKRDSINRVGSDSKFQYPSLDQHARYLDFF